MAQTAPTHVTSLYQGRRTLSFSLFIQFPYMIWRILRYRQCPIEATRTHQNKRLRALIHQCYNHVPFYQAIFQRSQLLPEDIQSVADLSKLPVITKEDIHPHPVRYITADNVNLDDCWTYTTSGTTGQSLRVYWEKKARVISCTLNHYLHQLACGEAITNRRTALASFTAPPPPLLQKLGIFPTLTLSPFDDTDIQLSQIAAYDPHTILATPSSLIQLAKEIVAHPEIDHALRVSRIFLGGEFLDHWTRTTLMKAFSADVYNSYGATEVGTIGHECLHQNMHVNHHTVLVEVTKDGEAVAPEEEGEITVTNLYNTAQPVLRYNLADIGYLSSESCPCGSSAPILVLTQGRKIEVIQRPHTTPLSVNEVCVPLHFLPGIKQFQLHQETRDGLTVKVVPHPNFTQLQQAEARRLIQQCLGPEMIINLQLVDQIPREMSGKFTRFITALR